MWKVEGTGEGSLRPIMRFYLQMWKNALVHSKMACYGTVIWTKITKLLCFPFLFKFVQFCAFMSKSSSQKVILILQHYQGRLPQITNDSFQSNKPLQKC